MSPPDAGAPPAATDWTRARQRSRELFAELSGGVAESRSRACRDELVRLHLPLVEHCAHRFGNRGEPHEDLVQVGTIGLLKAIDRFDAERGLEFSTYATPTIVGEIKRHFRDRGWAVRVPRRLQELRQAITTAGDDLAQELGRSPTPREISRRLDIGIEEVVEGLESANAYATISLDAGDSTDGTGSVLDTLGESDRSLEHVEVRESVRPLLEALPPREKQILLLRFFKGMTQSQIAEEIGVSQMHVSRLLNRTLDDLGRSLHTAR
ncbi:MAG: RNA polymerase sigma factor SigF [Marmoricola sp.]